MTTRFSTNDQMTIISLVNEFFPLVLNSKLKDAGFTSDNFSISIMHHPDGEITVRVDPLGVRNE